MRPRTSRVLFYAIKVSSLVALLILGRMIGTAAERENILRTLEGGAPEHPRFLIQAREQTTWYPARQAEHPVFASGAVSDRFAKMGAKSDQPLVSQFHYTYHFEDDVVLVTQTDTDWELEPSQRILVTKDTFFISHALRQTSTNNPVTRTGEILPRPPGAIMGWPQFLTRRIFADWLSHSPGITQEGKMAEDHFFRFTVPNASPAAPRSYHKVAVPVDQGGIFRIDFHLGDHFLYSSTKFQFHEAGYFTRASIELFSGTNVLSEKVLTFIGLDTNPPAITADAESFFVPGTLVNDSRGPTRVTYRAGSRLPQAAEIKSMANSKQALVAYESKTHTPAEIEAYKTAVASRNEAKRSALPFRRLLLVSAFLLSGIPLWLFYRTARKR